MRIFSYSILLILSVLNAQHAYSDVVKVLCRQSATPILTNKKHNQSIKITLIRENPQAYLLNGIAISLQGSAGLSDIKGVSLFHADKKGNMDTLRRFGIAQNPDKRVCFTDMQSIDKDTATLWLSVELNRVVDLKQTIEARCVSVIAQNDTISSIDTQATNPQRVGVALRQSMDDGVKSYRIPGLTTSRKGTLLAIYDIRRDSHRDLQGNMDIGLSRSTDGGVTWRPMQVIMDRGCWGGLPEKFNGVSDACILVDENSDAIFVAGLWMYGLLDKETGRWVKGLTGESTEHNHQWKNKASQPGFGVKQTSQFLIAKSTDDGLTWGEPMNITRSKKRQWWLYAPAPGHGITMRDGTLVLPSQGRDRDGVSFSNITWSRDGGKSWKSSEPAYSDVTECMAVELSGGALMLNMRDNRNRGRVESNGRRICTTTDLGNKWIEHPTSRKALIEPTCMGAIHRHNYIKDGVQKSVLLFSNPSSIGTRDNITIKMSFDDGDSWQQQYWILLDEQKGRGYSCITSIDNNTIGILYEGSQADMTFQQIDISSFLR